MFHDFTLEFGIEPVVKIVNGQIFSNRQPNNITRQHLMLAAATNDKICIDGLYILLHSDPAALIPGSSSSS
jgi:hypothetical protein